MKLALLGDLMLGRLVGERLRARGPRSLFDGGVVDAVGEADVAIANLECCISERGHPADKRFVFRAPPPAVEALTHLGISAVTLANNHALDFGEDALLDTLAYLGSAGIGAVGAGADVAGARRPIVLEARGRRIAVVGFTDHPHEFAAGPDRPGVAHATLRREGLPPWIEEVLSAPGGELAVVTPHWGPNMTVGPSATIEASAAALVRVGAGLVAGHSAHVFHGVAERILYDLGDGLDDYARDARLRNDLGILALVQIDGALPVRLEVVPLKLEHCFTRLATGQDHAWVRRRFEQACRELGTEAHAVGDRMVVTWPAGHANLSST